MNRWDKMANELLERVLFREMERPQGYDDDQLRQAIVHARHDIVLVVSHLSSVNRLLASIRYLLIAITLVLLMLCAEVAHFW